MSFNKKTWLNIPDPNNLPPIPEGQDSLAVFDADNMNRIEGGIEDVNNNLENGLLDAFEKIALAGMGNLVIHKITSSCTFTVPKAANQMFKVFAVGGGGGGGAGTKRVFSEVGRNLEAGGGGGAGGGIEIRTTTYNEGDALEITVGAGGNISCDGGKTSVVNLASGETIEAQGGGAGGNASENNGGNGGKGGSGGGGGGSGVLSGTQGSGGNGGNGRYGAGGASIGGVAGTSEECGDGGECGIVKNRAPISNDVGMADVLYVSEKYPMNREGSLVGGRANGYGEGGKCANGGSSPGENSNLGAGGGGGGYCGNGGAGALFNKEYDGICGAAGAGGGGGYCGNGGDGGVGCDYYYEGSGVYRVGGGGGGGGGGGFFCNGGRGCSGKQRTNASAPRPNCGGGGGGFFEAGIDGNTIESTTDKSGGNGGVIIMYVKEEVGL